LHPPLNIIMMIKSRTIIMFMESKNAYKIFSNNLWRRHHRHCLTYLGILELTVRLWDGLVWIRTQSNDGLLRTCKEISVIEQMW
jgi:hypothetical protein